MKTIEVRKSGDQFAVYVNGVETKTTCEKCKYYVNEDTSDCKMAKTETGEYRNDEKMFLFCGPVCGYFDIDI